MKKVLIVDDKEYNIEAAVEQLSDEYEVVCARSSSEALELLAEINQGRHGAVKKGEFDIVMTDCFMPAEPDGLSGKRKIEWAGVEIPAGLVIAILAARLGIEKIVICSDMGHHSHPISWMMDYILGPGLIACGCEHEWDSGDGPSRKDWKEILKKFSS